MRGRTPINWGFGCDAIWFLTVPFNLQENILPKIWVCGSALEEQPGEGGAEFKEGYRERAQPLGPQPPAPLASMGKDTCLVSRVEGRMLCRAFWCSLSRASFSSLRRGRAWVKMEFLGISCGPGDP